MEAISTFDIFKIGVGPSSSHTMGPWRAAQQFVLALKERGLLGEVVGLKVHLYGSLAKTGHGHGTDIAIIMGLSGEDPECCGTDRLWLRAQLVEQVATLNLGGEHKIPFKPSEDVVFHLDRALPFHANGLTFEAIAGSITVAETYYSVGGGFVVQEDVPLTAARQVELPYPASHAEELKIYAREAGMTLPQIVMENERVWRSDEEIHARIQLIVDTFISCAYKGCHTDGTLPGGLNVTRRAGAIHRRLIGDSDVPEDGWIARISSQQSDFKRILSWVSCFALAVNEENAAYGRVVTAPTNGAAGVVPAVLLYYLCFAGGTAEMVPDFMLTAGEIGSLFKKGATLSAAMGGCQAEIGVSSAMAAAALTQVLGGSIDQVLMAAEVAMEHHLGMTCDPIGGLVQIPCIERNTMGAIKAITAANVALDSDPANAKVSLDAVIRTMWQTALDMNAKYKETSEGGLAFQIPVSVSEC